jgi:hypothetical protein
LREGCEQRSEEEGAAPERFVLVHLEPELERNAPKNQRDEHHQDWQIEGREKHRVSQREGTEQPRRAKHQPGLVEVPDRRDRVHRDIALALVFHERKQDPEPEIEAVEQHVHEH